MPLKCIAVDDEPLALEILKHYISRCSNLSLLEVFYDAIEASEYLRQHPVDLLFADINMPDLTGLELVAALDIKPMIIFTTAHKKFAYEGFELEALDYLLKPIDFERFSRAVDRAVEYYSYRNPQLPQSPTHLFVRSEYRMIKIDLSDIDYIESMEDYIKIYLLSTIRPVLTLMSMKAVLEKLPADRFSRIHRSYVVPNLAVKSILNKKAMLTSGKELPIGGSYQQFIDDWGGSTN